MNQVLRSNRDINNSKYNNRQSKLVKKLNISQKLIANGLTKKQKQQIIRLISCDFAYDASHYLNKKAIQLDAQIGIQGSRWNFLHFSVKCNSLQCIQYALKHVYKQFTDEYQEYINEKTVQGFTPIMIAIMNQSNDALQLMQSFGGVEINLTDNKNLTPYELAINHKNQKAIRMLMNYQNQSKKVKGPVTQKLQHPCSFIKREKSCCHKSLQSLFQCLSFGMYFNPNINETKRNLDSSSRRPTILKLDYFNQPQVKISSSLQKQHLYQVNWLQLSERLSAKAIPLFQSFNPFSMSQPNISLHNNLILFQCLSQHPWLIRKVINIDKNKTKTYNVGLFVDFQIKKIVINQLIPFVKDREQPMFLDNNEEMWPILMQKALAKVHGGYFDIQLIKPIKLLQQLTGFPTFQIDLNHYNNQSIFKMLQHINKNGYLYALQGKQGSNLSSNNKNDCFSVLNFYQKGDKKLLLINCPFVDEIWKAKQKYQHYSLQLIKSHFVTQNQMCVWIQQQKLKQYFSKVIISLTLPNHTRQHLKLSASSYFFFTFKITHNQPQPLIIQLINLDKKQVITMSNVLCYANQGKKKVNFRKGVDHFFKADEVYSMLNQQGEYICYVQIDKKKQFFQIQEVLTQDQQEKQRKIQKLMMIMWSVDAVEPKYLDQTLGPVEFLQWLRINSMKYWAQSEIYKIQVICDYALILTKATRNFTNIFIQLNIQKNDIVQGKYLSQNSIQLQKQQGEYFGKKYFYYCVIRNASKYYLQSKTSFIKNDKKLDPAGQSSTGPKINFIFQ